MIPWLAVLPLLPVPAAARHIATTYAYGDIKAPENAVPPKH